MFSRSTSLFLGLLWLIAPALHAAPKKDPTTDPSTMATGSPFEQKSAPLPKEADIANKSADLQNKTYKPKSSTLAKPAAGLDKNYSLPSSTLGERSSTLGGKTTSAFDRDFKLRGSFDTGTKQPMSQQMQTPSEFSKKSKLEKPYQGKLPGAAVHSKEQMEELNQTATKQLSPEEVQEILNKNN